LKAAGGVFTKPTAAAAILFMLGTAVRAAGTRSPMHFLAANDDTAAAFPPTNAVGADSQRAQDEYPERP